MNSKFSIKLNAVDSGQVITIHAKAKSDAKLIDIELTESEDEKYCAEIPFHMSLRFSGNGSIVRNNRTKAAKWGKEEASENPIKSGEDFKVFICLEVDKFYVSIDGKPFCTFQHRKDFKQIRRLNVTNDVEKVYRVEHETDKQMNFPGNQTDTAFRLPITRKVKIGDIFVINGTIRGNSKGNFSLNIFDQEFKRQYLHISTHLVYKAKITLYKKKSSSILCHFHLK
jgi:Galactoside-binding lectin